MTYDSNGSTAVYTYSATGKKLGVRHVTANSNVYEAYCGNFIYRNGNLTRVLVDGGYITFSGTTPHYHFYLRDHLGNNRVVVNASKTVEEVNHYYPYGGLFGENAGSGVQPYKYNFSIERGKRKLACSSEREKNRPKVNGKELDRMHGLCTYDYGARQYDPVTARWDRMDPLCEKYYGISPYVYCAGDPVNFVDPDGNSIIITGKYSEEALNQIQAFVGDGLSLYYHNDYLCYTITDKDKLTQNAKKYIQMIDDTNIDIQISTVDSNQLMVGGAYLGHDVEKNENGDVVYVKAYQSVDPNVLDKADTYSEKGKMITHEVTEAYEGAKIGKKTGKDDKYRIKDNKIQQCKTYKTAHFRASEQNIVQERFISTPSGKAKQYYVTNDKGEETIIFTQ
jgi:RHS repeat-associated protein